MVLLTWFTRTIEKHKSNLKVNKSKNPSQNRLYNTTASNWIPQTEKPRDAAVRDLFGQEASSPSLATMQELTDGQ